MNKSAPTAMADVASLALEKHIEESIARAVPVVLAKFFSSEGLSPRKSLQTSILVPRATRQPSKGTESFMCAPTMEAGMKEEIRKSHGHWKTKEVFSFDDGLTVQQGPFLTVARPILASVDEACHPPPP